MTSINRISVLIFRIFLFLGIIGIITACSRKKNTWLTRNFHALSAQYNILYHGNKALQRGINHLEETYKDDYWHILPVEHLKQPENTPFKTRASRENSGTDTLSAPDKFKRAEEKATKAIQKHSMVIKGEEYNPQVEKAFLLLGKSRYNDQRYFPALEAFNYILRHYDTQELLNTAEIWKEKTYLRLGNNEERVITNLKAILSGNPTLYINTTRISKALQQAYLSQYDFDLVQNLLQIYFDRQKVTRMTRKSLTKENITQASSILAQAYLNIDEKEKALKPLSLAIKTTKNKKKKGRFLFICAQILEALHKPEQAIGVYDQVIALHRSSPRSYMIHAHVRKAELSIQNKESGQGQLNILKRLLKDRENRPYQDILNYQIGNYFRGIDSLKTAISYYQKALSANHPVDKSLRSRIYEIIGNDYVNQGQVNSAKAYYDSTLANLSPVSDNYYAIREKQLHPRSILGNDSLQSRFQKGRDAEKIYNKLYTRYKAGHYKKVLQEIEKYRIRSADDKMIPKLALLQATVKGRLLGFNTYREELKQLALNYPQTEEGEKAKELIIHALPYLKRQTFTTKVNQHYHLIYPFPNSDRTKAAHLRKKIEKDLRKTGMTGLSTSLDIYSPEKVFITINGLKSPKQTKSLVELLSKEKELPPDCDHFIISSENYKVLLLHKNLSIYRKEFDL